MRADGCESERDGGGQTENARGIYTDALVLFGQTRQRAEPYFVERFSTPSRASASRVCGCGRLFSINTGAPSSLAPQLCTCIQQLPSSPDHL